MVFIQHIKINGWKPYIAYDSELHLKHATNTNINGFSKFNFIYGENGVGKSTLSAILKFYGKGNAIGQNFDSKDFQKKGEVDFIFKHPNSTTALLEGNVLIFDRDFVADNIFIPGTFGYKAENDQKKERASKIKFGNVASIEEAIASLENAQKIINKSGKEKAFSDLEKQIAKYTGVLEINENGIKEHSDKTSALEKLETLNKSWTILKLKLDTFFAKDIKEIISSSLLQGTQGADRLMNVIKYGKEFVELNSAANCPLCNQALPGDIETYWHGILHDALSTLQKEIDNLLKELELLPVHDLLNKETIKIRINDHGKGLEVDASYINEVNESIQKAINEYQEYFTTNGNIIKGIEFSKIKAQLQLAEQEKSTAVTEYQRLATLIDEKKAEKTAEYNRYKDGLESFINDFLAYHGINYFKICMTTPSGTGRGHSQSLVDFEIKPMSESDESFSVKNMSEGEQRVLGLGFFFFLISQQIKSDSNFLKNKIIILDDPMTSFDTDKRKHLSRWIKESFVGKGLFSGIDQLFIFTHDDLFYKYLCKEDGITANRFRINKSNNGSTIELYNIEKILVDYKNYIERYIDNIDNGKTISEIDKIAVGQICRSACDYIIRKKIVFEDEENTSSLVERISSQNYINNLQTNKKNLEELKTYYQYYSQNGTNHVQDDIAAQKELYDYSKKVLDIINIFNN